MDEKTPIENPQRATLVIDDHIIERIEVARSSPTAQRHVSCQSLSKEALANLDVESTTPSVTMSTRANHFITTWFKDWWGLEILSLLLSTLCIFAIIIMLWRVDGRQMPKWRLGVTIDAVLSLVAGLSKSCLLMPTAEALGQLKWVWFRKSKRAIDFEVVDKASRGTWGAVGLLARSRGVTLASLGAAILLLSVPLDLFYQQIVRYPMEPVLDPSINATLSRVTYYNPSPEKQWRDGEWALTYDSELNALLYPFWTKNAPVPGVVNDCPSGNCTYDPFYTLAADYQCTEMPSTLLQYGCMNTSAEWHSTVAYQGPGLNPNMTSCGYYLINIPGNIPQLMSGYEVAPGNTTGEILATRFFSLTDVWTNQRFFDGSINFKGIKTSIADFLVVSTPDGFSGVLRNETPVITECELHWAVKKLQAKVSNGHLSEHVLETTVDFDPQPDENSTYFPWDAFNSPSYIANWSMTLPDAQSPTGMATYGLANATGFKVWYVWSQLSPSTYTRPSPTNPVKSGDVMKIEWTLAPPHLVEIDAVRLPWDAPANVSAHMANIMTTMNQVIRQNSLSDTNSNDAVVGKAYRYVIFVSIDWAWISFPVVLWAIAVVFLFSTIWRNSKDGKDTGVYKNSVLPLVMERNRVRRSSRIIGKRLGSIRKRAEVTSLQLGV